MIFSETRSARRRLGVGPGKATAKGRKPMAEQNFDARRMARDQETRIAAAAAVGLNAAKPFLQYQTSLLRLWADNCELIARNYEKGLDAFSNAIEQGVSRREVA
jgi:hypothetical protein